jgi:hypothetical protein
MHMRRKIVGIAIALVLAGVGGVTAAADTSPNGPGQPGAPLNTCGSDGNTATPGGSATASGSVFNSNGTAGTVYAGNPGTASLANANSATAVSQYDIACFQVSH